MNSLSLYVQQYLLHSFFQNISFYFSPFSRHGVTDSRGSRDERTGPFAFGTRIPYLRGPIGCRLLVGGFKKKSVSVWCIFWTRFLSKQSHNIWKNTLCWKKTPIRSMYSIFPHIWLICMVNEGKYTIHGSYGYVSAWALYNLHVDHSIHYALRQTTSGKWQIFKLNCI